MQCRDAFDAAVVTACQPGVVLAWHVLKMCKEMDCSLPRWAPPLSLPSLLGLQDESWDEPEPRFERYVDEMVRARIGKYLQPGHPAQLEYQEAMRVGFALRNSFALLH